MSKTFEVPRNIISNVLYRQTGIRITPSNIDGITAENISMAVVAFDNGDIDREKFNRVVLFNVNNLLEREGKPLFYQPRKDQSKFTKFRVSFFYN
jgi:hypothetical protein